MDRSLLSRDITIEQLDAYLANECTPGRAAAVHARLRDDVALSATVETLRQMQPTPDGRPIQVDVERYWRRFMAEAGRPAEDRAVLAKGGVSIGAERRSAGNARVRRHVTTGRFGLMAATACVLVALGIRTWVRWSGSSNASATRTFATKPGQQMTVRLADGSTAILAPATTLSATNAGITVAGEAYFTIAPHQDRPFVVRTANAIVRVLGTRFAVRQYPGDGKSRVVVEDGRVALQSALSTDRHSTPAVVSSQMMAYVSDSGVTVTTGIVPRDYVSWTHGVIVFRYAPLSTVAAELSRAYGVQVHVADTVLAKETLRLDVSVTEQSLTRVLDIIGTALEAHYTRQGTVFVISPGRGTGRAPSDVPSSQRLPQPERIYGR